VAGNGSGFTSGNPDAPEGAQVGFLEETGSFSQAVAGWAAGNYQISFDAAQRANFQASRQDFEVLVDGVVVGTFTPSGTSYQGYATAVFTVSAGPRPRLGRVGGGGGPRGRVIPAPARLPGVPDVHDPCPEDRLPSPSPGQAKTACRIRPRTVGRHQMARFDLGAIDPASVRSRTSRATGNRNTRTTGRRPARTAWRHASS
jgi:hypothetical protein